MAILRSFALFLLAGLFEIGGGYLVWLWLKEGKPLWFGILGGVILALYGIVATWQTAKFRASVCGLRRHFYCDGVNLGLEG